MSQSKIFTLTKDLPRKNSSNKVLLQKQRSKIVSNLLRALAHPIKLSLKNNRSLETWPTFSLPGIIYSSKVLAQMSRLKNVLLLLQLFMMYGINNHILLYEKLFPLLKEMTFWLDQFYLPHKRDLRLQSNTSLSA